MLSAFEACIRSGGVALFPADTVYGLACDPGSEAAVRRVSALKRRPPDKAGAVMFFDVEPALQTLGELPAATLAAARRLLPGAVTLLLPNPTQRFALACGSDPDTLGLRVPVVDHALREVRRAILQTSANLSGQPEARRLQDVPARLRAGADLLLDGGELPGTASTVVDLRGYAAEGTWAIVRHGLVPAEEVASRLT